MIYRTTTVYEAYTVSNGENGYTTLGPYTSAGGWGSESYSTADYSTASGYTDGSTGAYPTASGSWGANQGYSASPSATATGSWGAAGYSAAATGSAGAYASASGYAGNYATGAAAPVKTAGALMALVMGVAAVLLM